MALVVGDRLVDQRGGAQQETDDELDALFDSLALCIQDLEGIAKQLDEDGALSVEVLDELDAQLAFLEQELAMLMGRIRERSARCVRRGKVR